ncbi:putative RNA polymerase II nuclear localization protein SLC7A6OS [Microcaecilia unicolor]|uniref:Probable RNA polymerase II nuclear localization protein SLC7A6OS n=1 Tax=Microcaecilia unicolor TaxID=1415580 RepID=A0A6P7Y554_9AMPH|nr:probable RNA polymerase II nuclear localization protein SLC7A6OS [Microcaecilia unicolor]
MATTTVLRVKRKSCADPAEMLVLTCKRFRHETEVDPVWSPSVMEKNVFKLAGTVLSQSELFHKCVQEAVCREKAAQTLRPSLASNQRIRKDLRASKHTHRQESRYRLITSRRPSYGDGDLAQYSASKTASGESTKSDNTTEKENLETEGSSAAEANSENCDTFQLFDIIHEEVDTNLGGSTEDSSGKSDDPEVILCNSVRLIREQLAVSENCQGVQHREKDDYVYDIYYMDAPTQGWIQDILSVKPYSQEHELVDDEDRKSEEIYEDEDDENEENNWRNEYPDEDELLFEEDEEGNSDEDERYKDCSSDNDIRGTSWKKYCKNVLQEFGYDETPDFDSD